MRYIETALLATTCMALLAPATEAGTAEPGHNSIAIADSIRELAAEMAEIANQDDALALLTTEALDAGETVKRSPLTIMVRLQKDFGDKLNTWPVPGSKGGDNPDVYTTKEMNAKKEWVDKPHAFYKDLVADLAEGEAILETIAELDVADNTPEKGKKEHVELGTLGIQQARSMMRQRFDAMVELYRSAMRLHHKIAELHENFGDVVKVDYSRDKDKVTPKKATLPLFIQDIAEPTKAKAFGVKAFTNLNVAKAKAKGGDYFAIVSSGGRQGGEGQGAGDDDAEGFSVSGENFDDTTAAYANFWDDVDNVQIVYKELNAKDKAGNHVSDELLLSLATIAENTSAIIGKPAMAARLKALKAKQSEAA